MRHCRFEHSLANRNSKVIPASCQRTDKNANIVTDIDRRMWCRVLWSQMNAYVRLGSQSISIDPNTSCSNTAQIKIRKRGERKNRAEFRCFALFCPGKRSLRPDRKLPPVEYSRKICCDLANSLYGEEKATISSFEPIVIVCLPSTDAHALQ